MGINQELKRSSVAQTVEARLDATVKGKVIDITIHDKGKSMRIIGKIDRLTIVEVDGFFDIIFIVDNMSYTTPLSHFMQSCRTMTQHNGKVTRSATLDVEFED